MHKYFQNIHNTDNILLWESKALFNEVINPPTTSDNSLSPTLRYTSKLMSVKFNEVCLKQDKITFNHGAIVNMVNLVTMR